MEDSAGKIYEFGGFRLDATERLLFAGEKPFALAPKVFDTLLLLVENGGHLIRKEDMLNHIWAESFVEENNLAQNISYLRKILGENKTTKFIETVPKLGYRFVAPVNLIEKFDPEIVFEKSRARLFVENVENFEEDETEKIAKRGISINSAAPPISKRALPVFKPETQYVRNGDVNIAYQVVGSGDLDIVFVMGWVSHLEYFWKNRILRHF